MDIGEIEQEQLDYIKRNGVSVDALDNFPDPLKAPLDVPVVLTKEQEDRIIQDIRQQLTTSAPGVRKEAQPLNFATFISTLSNSFVGIMDDLLKFDGDLENLSQIFTKNNRMVFVATVLIIVSLALLSNR
jgi:hypothetical protein